MRLRRPLHAVQGDTLHIVGVGDNRIGKVCSCLVVVAVSLLVGCGPGALNRSEALNPSAFREQASDIARTFEYATIVLPGRNGEPPLVTRPDDDGLSRHLERFGQDVRFPTVLYLHGCTGLESLRPLQAFARQGFAVLAPNSFARRYRPLQCRPSERTGGLNVFVFDFRLTEITYALARITELDWVDRERLFLVGTSEGGLAAALPVDLSRRTARARSGGAPGRTRARGRSGRRPLVRSVAYAWSTRSLRYLHGRTAQIAIARLGQRFRP